jgi:RNA recognition motif-containing protein
MNKTSIYIGNLPYSMSEDTLRRLFEQFGIVMRVRIVVDFEIGRSKGFGFVEMSSAADAEKAIDGINQRMVEGRTLWVSWAKPKESRAPQPTTGRRETNRVNQVR